jgi:hypothetical protein
MDYAGFRLKILKIKSKPGTLRQKQGREGMNGSVLVVEGQDRVADARSGDVGQVGLEGGI